MNKKELLKKEDEIYKLENYCRKWGIKGQKFYNREFDCFPHYYIHFLCSDSVPAYSVPAQAYRQPASDLRKS